MAVKKSQFFRCFVAGNTISDGRQITPEMIDEVVSTFNVATYAPRINIEHIAGYSPEPPFNGYGTVTAVKAQVDDITINGKVEKRKALYAQVDGNAQLVQLAANDQKPFPSVELTPSYAGCGKVGLIGLAFTDTPASIGTQALQFSRTSPGTLFTAGADPVDFGFQTDPADPSAGAFSAMKAFFTQMMGGGATPVTTPPVPANANPPAAANDNEFARQMREGLGLINASIVALGEKQAADIDAVRTEFGTLKTRIEQTDASGFSRPPATGTLTDAQYATDC